MPTEPSKRQTQSFLRKRFAEIGIQPRAKLGQNFLIDLNLQHALIDDAKLQPNDVVLEVGTGTGSLTALMAPHVATVVTVEVDADLHALATEELSEFDNIRMLQFDVLKNKNQLAPQLLEVLKAELDAEPGRCLKLAANLPYHVATPLMSNLLMLDWPPKQMTVTIQKELADRIVARPKTKDYSALSVWMQSQCRTELLRIMSPSVFWPRPKVTSAIVQVTLDQRLRDRIPDRAYFHQFVRSMFFHRRKFLRSELLSAYKKRIGKPEVDQIMADMNLIPTARAEELSVGQLLELCERMKTFAGD